MRRLDLDLLQALVTVAETGSLSAAAPCLCRSQSAVSEQIRKLEEAAGVALLVRGKAGAHPTPAGERLISHARKILLLHDAACEDMRGVALQGEIRLAITDYFRPAAIAALLRRLREQYPRLRLHVSILKSAVVEENSAERRFDIGISMRILEDSAPPPDGRIQLRREALSWIAAPDLDVAPGEPLPLIALPGSCALRTFQVRVLDDAGVAYFIAHSASGLGGVQSALVAGLGVSCLNASAIPAGLGAYRGLVLPPLPKVEFALVPPRLGEAPIVSDVRAMLAAQFGAGTSSGPLVGSPGRQPMVKSAARRHCDQHGAGVHGEVRR